jgi:glutaminyl-tRNA synthetase
VAEEAAFGGSLELGLAPTQAYVRVFSADTCSFLDVPQGGDFVDGLNPESVEILDDCRVEPALAALPVGETCQFERHGYFCADADADADADAGDGDGSGDRLVYNRTVTLRDTWAKIEKKGRSKPTKA